MTETLEQYRRAEHLCLRCGRYDDWTEEGHRLCWRCMVGRDAMTEAETKRIKYKRRKEAGQCVQCGQWDDTTLAGAAYCRQCAARRARAKAEQVKKSEAARQQRRKAVIRMRDKRKAAGMCVVCGKAPARAGKTLCKKCADVQRIRQAEHYKHAGAAGTLSCPYAAGLEDLGEYACLHCPRPNTCIYDVRDRDGD